MKTKIYPFLTEPANIELSEFRFKLCQSAKTMDLFPIKDLSENPRVIELEKFLTLFDNLPLMVVFRVAKTKLDSIQVYGLERKTFEENLSYAGDIETFLKNFPSVNPLSEDAFFKIVESLSIPFSEAQQQEGKFLRSQDWIENVSLKVLMARIIWQCDGYNNWYGTNFIQGTNKMMSRLNTASNLIMEKSILPAAVYHDAIDIMQAVNLIFDITDFLCGGKGDPWYVSDDVERDRTTLEEKLKDYTEKYPCLAGKNYSKFGAILLREYTMSPAQMVERLGQIPFPFPSPYRTDANKPRLKNTSGRMD